MNVEQGSVVGKGPTCYRQSYNTMGGKHLKSHFLGVFLFSLTLTP